MGELSLTAALGILKIRPSRPDFQPGGSVTRPYIGDAAFCPLRPGYAGASPSEREARDRKVGRAKKEAALDLPVDQTGKSRATSLNS